MFFDSHCHLTDERLGIQREAILERSRAAQVSRIVSISVDLDDSEKILSFTDGQEIFASVGVHPQNALSWNEGSATRMEALAAQPHVVALGEMGLDYLYDETHPDYPGATRTRQEEVFEAQLEIAARLKLPIVIHNRLADERLLEIVANYQTQLVGGVFHCFSSSPEIARRVLDLGFHLGFTGIVTFKKAFEVQESALLCPLDRMLIETDAPYLAPMPYRGKMNEPSFVPFVAAKLGELRGLTGEAMGEITTRNTLNLFAIRL